MQQPETSAKTGNNGKLVVVVMLVLGSVAGYFLSRNMPRRNPKLSDPGSPYYSPPNEDEIKAMREQEMKPRTR